MCLLNVDKFEVLGIRRPYDEVRLSPLTKTRTTTTKYGATIDALEERSHRNRCTQQTFSRKAYDERHLGEFGQAASSGARS